MVSKGSSTGPEAEIEGRPPADVPSRGRSDLLAGWLRLPLKGLILKLHLLILPVAAALWVVAPDLGERYLLLLATLLLHELGHALSSLALGADRAEVSILPVFGRAFVVRFRDRREAWIALSGPALNLLVAGVLLLLGGRFELHLRSAPLVDFLFTINLLMGAGNLLPVRPLDGGRALAALTRS